MKKIYTILGRILIAAAIIFFLADSFIVINYTNETFGRDMFGLAIPTPPTWISFVPYFGSFFDFLFQFFSIHGLVELIILTIIGTTASYLVVKGRS